MTIQIDVSPETIQTITKDLDFSQDLKSVDFLFSILTSVYSKLDAIDNENEEFRQVLQLWQKACPESEDDLFLED